MQGFSTVISIVALAVSLSALAIAVLNYRRKSSNRFRGKFVLAKSIFGDDEFVSSVTLENLKDRSVTIFSIYLRVGRNYYIEIADFDENPLIVKPFETWHSEFEPIDFYAVSTRKIDLNHLFSKRDEKFVLILSTTEGKIKVKPFKKHWDPVHDYLVKNPLTVPINAVRVYYKGKAFGGKTKFIIEVGEGKSDSILVPVHDRDAGIEKLAGIVLTKESLVSAAALEAFLNSRKKHLPALNHTTFSVIDFGEVRRSYGVYDGGEKIVAPGVGFLVYHLLSPLMVRFDRYRRGITKKGKSQQPEELDGDRQV